MNVKNVAFYSFFKPSYELQKTRDILYQRMLDLKVKGSIILGDEGINCSISAVGEDMDTFLQFLFETIGINTPALKISFSPEIAFKRARIKVKPDIVAKPGMTPIDPMKDCAPYISPEEFHQWIKDNRKMVVLDTRNDFEYKTGRFKDSIHLGTKHFADFENDLSKAPQEWQDTTVVAFCTGGIRCEKAAPLMLKKGFHKVYQLDGGILNYFEKVGRDYFDGDCFVFDERIAI